MGDDSALAIVIGFPFTFYEVQYNQVRIHSNGGLTFGPDVGLTDPITHLPESFWYSGTPNTSSSYNRNCNTDDLSWDEPTIAAYWTDLDPSPPSLDGDAGVYSILVGEPGQRRLIISWYQIPYYNPAGQILYPGKNQFEVKLFEADNHIEVHYAVIAAGPPVGNGKAAAVGLSSSQGDHELLFSCGEAVISNNSAIAFYQEPCNDTDADGVCEWEDCDNGNGAVYPGAPELCNDIDDDCDGQTDESPATGEVSWYPDLDGDGFGAGGAPAALLACEQPDNYSASDDDCDDNSADVYPGAPELCDDIDNDCDSATSEDSDLDGDGSSPCDSPPDCDDSDASLNPADADGDGISSCSGDCNDSVQSIAPGAVELCDGYDNDCDGRTDENPLCEEQPPPGSDVPYGCILSCSASGNNDSGASRPALLALWLTVLAGLRRRRKGRLL
jgi:MYXO-CTERM domain-containing protein